MWSRSIISADWPMIVHGQVKYLTTTLLYEVASGKSISPRTGLLGHWGSPVAFHCQSGREDCYSVDMDAGEVTFRNAIVRDVTA